MSREIAKFALHSLLSTAMKISHIIFFAVIAAASFVFVSCAGAGDVGGALSRAESAMSDGYHDYARVTADSIMGVSEEEFMNFSPVTLCRLAVIYKKLADTGVGSEDADLAIALRCYRRAFALSADSVITFRRGLTLDDAAAFEVLSKLTVASDRTLIDSDSCVVETEEFDI